MTCTMRASTWFDRLLPRVCLDCELHTRAPFDLCEHCAAALPWNVPACVRCALPLPAASNVRSIDPTERWRAKTAIRRPRNCAGSQTTPRPTG
jgi:predicted amidophosphoribosyltransferase